MTLVKVFNDLGQLPVHFFDLLRVDHPTHHSLCDHQYMPNREKSDCLLKRPRLT